MQMHSLFCDGCERELGELKGWMIHAIRIDHKDEELDGEEFNTDVCDQCMLKMKYFRVPKK